MTLCLDGSLPKEQVNRSVFASRRGQCWKLRSCSWFHLWKLNELSTKNIGIHHFYFDMELMLNDGLLAIKTCFFFHWRGWGDYGLCRLRPRRPSTSRRWQGAGHCSPYPPDILQISFVFFFQKDMHSSSTHVLIVREFHFLISSQSNPHNELYIPWNNRLKVDLPFPKFSSIPSPTDLVCAKTRMTWIPRMTQEIPPAHVHPQSHHTYNVRPPNDS